LGRLTKAKIDQIKKLYGEGWTKKEISKKLQVSRSTVAKYAGKELEKELETPGVSPSPVLEVVVKNFFELLLNLNIATYLSKDDYPQIIDSTALKLLTEIAKTDKDFVKRLINNPYLDYLRETCVLDLTVPDAELNGESVRQRKAWISFFKKYLPEELARLM